MIQAMTGLLIVQAWASLDLPPLPSRDRILSALPKGEARSNARMQYQVLLYDVGPVRVYPPLGRVRLVQLHLLCIVDSDQGRDLVYVDLDRFRLVEE